MLLGRTMAFLVLLAPLAVPQPQLTTIQDTLYKADGTRFNGSALITWKTFESADTSNIGTQSLTAPIVNGTLRVQLVPNSQAIPSNPYTVRYQSDGRAQFTELWIVPPSALPLRLRDVRDGPTTGTVLPPPGQTPILEADVVGLAADLGLRPVKGTGFGVGRTAIVSDSGTLETVVGNLSDCVKVDGTAGPCADPNAVQGPTFVDAESPSGIVDGSNASFTLSNAPSPVTSLALYRNGILQKSGFDYSLTNATIQFVSGAMPQPADTLLASYRLPAAGGLVVGGLTQQTSAAEVVCGSTGTSTSSAALTSLGNCTLTANFLQPGDRIEIRFAYGRSTNVAGFDFLVRWGATTVVQRTAGAADSMITGRGDAGVYSGGAQVSAESWGNALGLQTGLTNALDSVSAPLKIDFLARAGSDHVTLRNYTVLRYRAR